MSFDIEKMKADGVSEHLIYLASVAPEVLSIRVARRLENDRLFQQFMSESAGEIEQIYPYAVAAGLMSEADRLWLVDAGNSYISQGEEVWFTGTIDTSAECQSDIRIVALSPTPSADIPALKSDPEGYSVKMNEMELPVLENDCEDPEACGIAWFETEDAVHGFGYSNADSEIERALVPCDWTGDVEVTVSHK